MLYSIFFVIAMIILSLATLSLLVLILPILSVIMILGSLLYSSGLLLMSKKKRYVVIYLIYTIIQYVAIGIFEVTDTNSIVNTITSIGLFGTIPFILILSSRYNKTIINDKNDGLWFELIVSYGIGWAGVAAGVDIIQKLINGGI